MAKITVRLNPPNAESSPIINVPIPRYVFVAGTDPGIDFIPLRLGKLDTTWELISGLIVVTTAAAVANRVMGIYLYDQDGNEIGPRILSEAIAASTTYAMQLGKIPYQKDFIWRDPGCFIGLGGFQLSSHEKIFIKFDANGQNDDIFTGFLQFKYLGAGLNING